MSIRADVDDHIRVRGTMVSTLRTCPSRLPVRCVEQWGLPNARGQLICDNAIVYVQFDRKDDTVLHAWAMRLPEPLPPYKPIDAWGANCGVQ